MSLFRSLQGQSRILTIFCKDVNTNRIGQNIVNYINEYNNRNNKLSLEIHDKFPTQDQLLYMYKIDKRLLNREINKLDQIFKLPSHDKIYGDSLDNAVKKGIWNDGNIWIDWEKQKMGDTLRSIQEHLTK